MNRNDHMTYKAPALDVPDGEQFAKPVEDTLGPIKRRRKDGDASSSVARAPDAEDLEEVGECSSDDSSYSNDSTSD